MTPENAPGIFGFEHTDRPKDIRYSPQPWVDGVWAVPASLITTVQRFPRDRARQVPIGRRAHVELTAKEIGGRQRQYPIPRAAQNSLSLFHRPADIGGLGPLRKR